MLATAAICVHAASLREASVGMKLYARAVVATEDQKELLKTKAKQHGSRSRTVAVAGFGVALGSAVCLIASRKRLEPARRVIPFGLLVFYVMLQFLLV